MASKITQQKILQTWCQFDQLYYYFIQNIITYSFLKRFEIEDYHDQMLRFGQFINDYLTGQDD